MTPTPINAAAWLTATQAPLEVKSAPYTAPRENEIVVKNHAVAVNPLDWLLQVIGYFIFPWIKYPFVLGSDLAGEVFEVGKGVTRFKVGDRVLGHAVGSDKKRNASAEGAFQTYTVVLAHMAAPIPSTMPYESAAVLPLPAACSRKTTWRSSILPRPRSRRARLFSFGAARRASAAMPSSSPSRPAMRSSRPHRRGTSNTSRR